MVFISKTIQDLCGCIQDARSCGDCGTITGREMGVCMLILMDYDRREIADMLYLSDRTVGTHLHSIRKKLEVKSRSGGALRRRLKDAILGDAHAGPSILFIRSQEMFNWAVAQE